MLPNMCVLVNQPNNYLLNKSIFCIFLQMHFLYQYSLHFFLDTYHTVLYENANLKSISDHSQRLAVITKDLFQV